MSLENLMNVFEEYEKKRSAIIQEYYTKIHSTIQRLIEVKIQIEQQVENENETIKEQKKKAQELMEYAKTLFETQLSANPRANH